VANNRTRTGFDKEHPRVCASWILRASLVQERASKSPTVFTSEDRLTRVGDMSWSEVSIEPCLVSIRGRSPIFRLKSTANVPYNKCARGQGGPNFGGQVRWTNQGGPVRSRELHRLRL
jgi:hypothetical protein